MWITCPSRFVWRLLLAEDRQRARAVVLHEIAALDHEILDHAVHRGVLVPYRDLGDAPRFKSDFKK